jgi:putative membrane protein
MKLLAVLGLWAGLALTTLLVLTHGVGAIWHDVAALGWGGFAVLVAYHLVLTMLMGCAWWRLGRGRAAWPYFAWSRLIRDSAGETLPLSQLGGYVLGARALALAGASTAFAAGSTVVDVTVELVAQLSYTLIGLALLHGLRPESALISPLLAGVAIMAVLVAVFVAVQARGAGVIERISARIASELLGRSMAGSGAVQSEIQQIHRHKTILLGSCAIHLTTWVLSGVETWITLRLMGIPISLTTGLVIDSLLYGMRSVAFMVPNAFGVQEGGLVFLGSLFGVDADTALALSFVKRGRDLAIGVPALLVWQAIEARRAWSGVANPADRPETPPVA